jgi:hypothetical protein
MAVPVAVHVSEEGMEEAHYIVCLRDPDTSGFTDNAHGKCSVCDHDVHFRPYMTKAVPEAVLLCMDCALKLPPPDEVRTCPEQVDELTAMLASWKAGGRKDH